MRSVTARARGGLRPLLGEFNGLRSVTHHAIRLSSVMQGGKKIDEKDFSIKLRGKREVEGLFEAHLGLQFVAAPVGEMGKASIWP